MTLGGRSEVTQVAAARGIEPGAFDAVSNLEHVWLGGNELNCSSVRGSLPSGVECIEEHCEVERPDDIGDGSCDREQNPEVYTARCAWDGGDCAHSPAACSWWLFLHLTSTGERR